MTEKLNINPLTISPENFYGSSESEPILTSKPIVNNKSDSKSASDHPSWGSSTFGLQDLAFQEADTRSPKNAHIFSFEKQSSTDSTRGSRRYLVSSYNDFWKRYSLIPAASRHYYELIRENKPCSLYFDIEFEYQYNTGLDGITLLDKLLQLLLEDLQLEFSLNLRRSDILDLESSNDSKFSHHIIVKPCVFINNIDMGYYVKHFVLKLFATDESTFFPFNSQGERRPMIDTSVYTKNRNFRLFLSSKLGKTSFFKVGSLNGYPYSPGDLAGFFFASLVCNIPSSIKRQDYISFYPRALELSQAKAKEQTPAFVQVKLPSITGSGSARVGDVSITSSSPYPDLDTFIQNHMRNWPGKETAILRSWKFFEGSGLLIYNIGNNRFCERIQREHKSNHISITCDLKKRFFYQTCHDPDCRAESFTGVRYPIPLDLELPGFAPFEYLDNILNEFDVEDFVKKVGGNAEPMESSPVESIQEMKFEGMDWVDEIDPDLLVKMAVDETHSSI